MKRKFYLTNTQAFQASVIPSADHCAANSSTLPVTFSQSKTKLSSLLLGVLVALTACHSQEASIDKASKGQIVNTQNHQTDDVFADEVVLKHLVDFNNDEQLSWLKLTDTQTAVVHNSSNNSQSLKVDFPQTANIPKLTIKPDSPWNVAEFPRANLALNVTNTSDESIQLYVDITNPLGQYQSRSISLVAGYNGTIYFPLSGIEAQTDTGVWGDVIPWNTNDDMMVWRSWREKGASFTELSSLSFFTIGNLRAKSVIIDDIRIRQNPPVKTDNPFDYLVGLIDRFGQNNKQPTALHINSETQLKALADNELSQLQASSGMPNRSQYGGYTQGPKLNATGYFRTEKVDGKWWMVDPEGNLFFSHGPANVRMANMSTLTGIDYDEPQIRVRTSDEITPEDSMGIVDVAKEVKEKRYVISSLRHDMFTWLPDYDAPLAKHYSYRRTTHKGPIPYGETYSFYRANLERRYNEMDVASYPAVFKPSNYLEENQHLEQKTQHSSQAKYLQAWQDVTAKRMHDWGFTSFGNWVDPGFYQSNQVPYFANGWIIGDFKTLSGKTNHWGLMPDPFDPVFAERAQITIDAIAKDIQSSPWCAGIFIDNEKSWGEREGSVEARYGVILDALSKPASQSPAKKAFVKVLQEQYGAIDNINAAWGAQYSQWSDLNLGLEFADHTPELIADLSLLLEKLGEQYFNVVHNTLEKVLPNHLYMGARMANWGMPDEIIKASLKYSDVLSFNIYEEGLQTDYWQFLEKVDLPVVVGEFHIGTATDSGMYSPGIVHAANQADRARMYKAYMKSVLEKPYMVGAHWFQYIDEPITGRAFDGENANIGFVTVTDVPYPEMIQAVKQVTSTMYQQRYGQ
ncbi:agarase [Shewanella japonica]|uniref:Beta-agarase B n=1 Tax=Shewanella japonica TaxID=93973 RepID=A0ABM6JIZ5_9GAMM|nr:agarase [Shewanella japonica]ARD22210.1 Beta-agarase B [Shewanella japonica]